ncbi:MAG: methyl-accepting chemotaxis protein [Pseudomonadota bacterium]
MRYERALAVETWFEGVSDALHSESRDHGIVEVISSFEEGFKQVGADPVEHFHRLYIEENPYPLGDKDALVTLDEPSAYNNAHSSFHKHFQNLAEVYGFYDVFLFNVEGDMIYSVEKETDFATNFLDGAWASSGLGAAFRRAVAATSDAVIFEDFAPYGPSADAPASFAAVPIFGDDGSTVGVLAIQTPAEALSLLVSRKGHLGETAEVILIGEDGALRVDSPRSEANDILKTTFVNDAVRAALEGGEGSAIYVDRFGREVLSSYSPLDIAGVTWAIVAEISTEEVFASLSDALILGEIAAAGLALIIAALGWLISRGFTRPLVGIQREITAVQGGDFAVEIKGVERGDEIGAISGALQAMRDALGEAAAEREAVAQRDKEMAEAQALVVDDLRRGLSALAEGDLTDVLATPFAEDYEPIRRDFNDAAQRLRQTMNAVTEKAGSVGGGAGEVSHATNDLAHRTESQAAALEETVAALKQLSIGLKGSAKNADDASRVTEAASHEATASEEVMVRSLNAMQGLKDSSSQITQIIAVIDDIAFQTNLLALNAGVEAARAGEAGRGFAVVASEVRALAQRCTGAAQEVNSLITNSNQQVRDGVELVTEASEALSEIINKVEDINGIVMRISSSAQEQSGGVNEIMAAMDELDQVTQRNAAMVEEMTAASSELANDAALLTKHIGEFTVGADPAAHVRKAAAAPQVTAAQLKTPVSAEADAAKASSAFEKVAPSRSPSPTTTAAGAAAALAVAEDDDDWEAF